MIRAPGWTGLIALLMVLGGCAASVPHEIDASSIRPLIEFVERETGYVLDPPPTVAAVPRDRLRITSAGSLGAAEHFEASYSVVKWAAGDGWMYGGIIRMDVERFSLADPYQRSAIVHELVHHGQMAAIFSAKMVAGGQAYLYLLDRKAWACSASLEAEAYEIQNRYLAREAPQKSVSRRHIDKVSKCLQHNEGPDTLIINATDVSDLMKTLGAKDRLQ